MLDIALTIILIVLGIFNIVFCLIVVDDGADSAILNTIFSIGIVIFNVVLVIYGFVSEYGKYLRLVEDAHKNNSFVLIIILCIIAGITALIAVWTGYNGSPNASLITGSFTALFITLALIPMITLQNTSLDELKAQAKKNEDISIANSIEYTEDNLYLKPIQTEKETVTFTVTDIIKEINKEDKYIVKFDLVYTNDNERTYAESDFNKYLGKGKTHVSIEKKTMSFLGYESSSGYGYKDEVIVYVLPNDADFDLDYYANKILRRFNDENAHKDLVTPSDNPNLLENTEGQRYIPYDVDVSTSGSSETYYLKNDSMHIKK